MVRAVGAIDTDIADTDVTAIAVATFTAEPGLVAIATRVTDMAAAIAPATDIVTGIKI